MAKKSSIEKNNRRKKLAKKYAGRRSRLKAIAMDKTKPMEERFAATMKMAELPRNSAANRYRNRCEMTGRPRAVYRKHKLSRIALPRVRDFKGVSSKSFDGKGNYTLGIREQIIFPEINYDKIEKIKGMNITIVTTAKNDEEGRALLRHMGMPFRTA